MGKRIIVVHGRSTKPCKEKMESLVKDSLLNGLGRVSSAAKNKINDG